MGAGLAGSTTVDVNVNGNQGGGSKKQGLPGITNMRSSLVFSVNQRAYGTPDSRNKIFYINQLSRVGAKSAMFASTADGVQSNNSTSLNMPIFIYLAIQGINEVYGDDYEVVLAGESETLAEDLNIVHMDTNTVPDNFFQKMQEGNELYDALPEDTKKLIELSNMYLMNENLGWNNGYEEDNIDYGNHMLTLIPKEDSDHKMELNEKGFGVVNFTFSFKLNSQTISTEEIPIYRKHKKSFWHWIKKHKTAIISVVASVAVVALAVTGVGLVADAELADLDIALSASSTEVATAETGTVTASTSYSASTVATGTATAFVTGLALDPIVDKTDEEIGYTTSSV